MSEDERIAAIEAENHLLRQALDVALVQNAMLLERVHDLGARRAKDSHNSSQPPSSDGLARKTKSLQMRSGKKPGDNLGMVEERLPCGEARDGDICRLHITECARLGREQSWHVLCGTLVRFTVFGLVAATAPILERGRLLITFRYLARRWGSRLSHWRHPGRSTAATPDGLW